MSGGIGIVIPTYNRPDYLRQCLESLAIADLPLRTTIYLIDDGSTNPTTQELVREFRHPTAYVAYSLDIHKGVCGTLLRGFNQAIDDENEFLMVLDADAVVRNDFMSEMFWRYNLFKGDRIFTGFNCNTLNKDGSERHKIVEGPRIMEGGREWVAKKSVGGLHMMFSAETYESTIKPVLETAFKNGGNWDHMACIAMEKKKKPVICTVPSVVQHIGIISAMGHGTGGELPDTADDFKPLSLPNITLVGIDCVNFPRLENAAEACMQNIEFGAVKLLTSEDTHNPNAIRIDAIKSREDYSEFMIKRLADYINTDYAMVIQYDGYILNYKAWTPEFLNCDYIGAPWWYKDGMNVGNGGFSLRSRKLLKILQTDEFITQTHPEDHHICRTYRRYLTEQGVKFASEETARKFSVEGWKGDKSYVGQFGFHGHSVKKPEPVNFNKSKTAQTLIISQFQGIGDILFCMPLVEEWIEEGNKIIWPVIDDYIRLNKHFPQITFVGKDLVSIDHNRKEEHESHGARVIPLRWADQILKLPYKDVMKAKYQMYGSNWRNWHNLTWKRDMATEKKIFNSLGLKEGQKFNLINKRFRSDQTGIADIKVDNGLPNIEMRNIPGTTLLDWGMVIEAATEIHTVHTAVVYIIDRLETTDNLHQYLRKPDEKDFKFTDYLWTKDYRYHF